MYSPEEMAPLLLVFSLFSKLISWIKNGLYDHGFLTARKAPLPVISVGNISLGGTEKTPLAGEILCRLLERSRRPALVSRGYKGRWEKMGGVLSNGHGLLGSWEDGGDEPFLIARSYPAAGVYVGKNRLISCRRAASAGFDIVVLDDGFQHRRLARDLDIVLFSSAEKIALREPRSALRRADLVLIKAGDKHHKAIARLKGSGKKTLSYSVVSRGITDLWTEEDVPPDRLMKKKLAAFCGIARPSRFLKSLQGLGFEVVSFFPYPDHYSYPDGSLGRVVRACHRSGAEALVTTEKDGLKIAGRRRELAEIPTFVLRIGLAVDPAFDDLLKDFIKQRPAAR
jgi:tetraacyldisaccharide 4'-kinase